MAIRILESNRLYSAEPSPPDTDMDWSTPKPLTREELINELYARGTHQTDIGDAFYLADPSWLASEVRPTSE
jgi:hypothetical protein